MVKLLNSLKGVEYVVSSTWRKKYNKEELTEILQSFGFTGTIFDVTPNLNTIRGLEIKKWLSNNSNLLGAATDRFKDYVILDDEGDMLYWQRHNFIQVDSYTGITPTHIFKIKQMLDL